MVNLRIDADLWAAAKAQAAREDRPLVRFVERAIRAELARAESTGGSHNEGQL